MNSGMGCKMKISFLAYKIIQKWHSTSDNTAYALRANALALWDIAPFDRNVVYAGNVR